MTRRQGFDEDDGGDGRRGGCLDGGDGGCWGKELVGAGGKGRGWEGSCVSFDGARAGSMASGSGGRG